ncbi:MAG: sulfatase [Anaerolineae bacterium]|nr:sulfatase [Anaerolineae bacterium]
MSTDPTEKVTGPEYADRRGQSVQSVSTPSEPYNILIINSDTYRYDNLFDRAAVPVETPNLDAFSERAVSMSRFYAGSFPTIPERTDLISGRYAWPWVPWQYLLTENVMPQMLNQHGYVTQLICDCPHLFNFGFNRVFNAAVQVRGQEGDTFSLHMNDPIKNVMPREKTRTGYHFQDRILVDIHRWTNRYWRCEEDTFPPRTAGKVVRWLEENDSFRPWLLWVDFFDPHEPWDPPEYMVQKYNPDYDGLPMMHPNYGRATDYTPAELRNLRAHYCAEAELVDRWVGRIFQKLDDLALWDKTIVIFTTDHGMSLGEHERTGKSNINDGDDRYWPLYPEIAHIPFLIAGPGLAGGTIVDLLAQPADILPTLIELNGLDLTPPTPFHGRSFAASLQGPGQDPIHDYAICGCFLRARDGKVPSNASTPMIYTEKWAYGPIGPDGKPELYDLEADPYAETNQIAAHPDVAAEMHAQMTQWLRDIGAPEAAIEVYG